MLFSPDGVHRMFILSRCAKKPHFYDIFRVSDCTPPFNIGVRTSNENRGGVPVTEIRGQTWDQEEASVHARGTCLNFEQILCT